MKAGSGIPTHYGPGRFKMPETLDPIPVPVCIATSQITATVIISQAAAPYHFQPLLRVQCPCCDYSHIHSAGTDSTAYWRIPHCRIEDRRPYVVRIRPVDRWLIFAWLREDDRIFTVDDDGFVQVEHAICKNLSVVAA